MEIPYAELHSFPDGDRPHTGNPAGVALLEVPISDADMLGLAQSNNLSETAFLVPGEAVDVWNLRWFTPGCEVSLCGHATLAAAVWLFETGRVAGETAGFDTASGRLAVTREADDAFVMDFPRVDFRPAEPDPDVVAALGAGAPEAAFDLDRVHGPAYRMFVYADEAAVAGLNPDIAALAAAGVNVIATAPGASADFVSRFFAPASGVAEDPVTGSAHCTLAPYWAERLGRAELAARQIGRRPGALRVRARNDGRVELIGTARRYLDGVIRL
ncbi:PhzF family phenazine biosynthesis protein [Marinicauda salina]|uniref:PhzF family phenazine biosynthesis protein n=1 Tax=Marinicauda salina TaxID=2135793 RepID=A0A2U2BY62_9PROT|nr:PhzF family phenazine biosynthesis protein [Marinicauda salina]